MPNVLCRNLVGFGNPSNVWYKNILICLWKHLLPPMVLKDMWAYIGSLLLLETRGWYQSWNVCCEAQQLVPMYKISTSANVSVTVLSSLWTCYFDSGCPVIFFLIRCCNQFRLPVCTTEDAVHTKRLNVSQLVLLFSAHLRFCFCSSINVQILLSLSPHYSEFLVHVWCALFDFVQKAERVQSLPVGCACISLCGTCGHVHYILEKEYAVTQKRKAVKIKTCKRHRLGAKVQSSLRGARFRKGIVGIRTCAEMCTCNRIR